MAHNASKVLMGMTQSSDRTVTNKKGSIEAGLICRSTTTDGISIAKADGEALGISAGKDLSDAGRTAIVRKGLGVPVLLAASVTPVIGTQVFIDDVSGKAVNGPAGAGKTGMNATYASGKLTAIKEDGTENSTDGCALIDMPGGL